MRIFENLDIIFVLPRNIFFGVIFKSNFSTFEKICRNEFWPLPIPFSLVSFELFCFSPPSDTTIRIWTSVMAVTATVDQNSWRLHLWKMYKLSDVLSSILVVNCMRWVRILKLLGYVPIQNLMNWGKIVPISKRLKWSQLKWIIES